MITMIRAIATITASILRNIFQLYHSALNLQIYFLVSHFKNPTMKDNIKAATTNAKKLLTEKLGMTNPQKDIPLNTNADMETLLTKTVKR